MPKISADIILYSFFLGANLIIGLVASRRVKTLREYSIGNKDFSTATLTSTIVATWIGGGFMFYALQNIYTDGLLFIIPMVGGTLCLLFTGRILAIRMGEFLNNLSVAEAMGDLYGRSVRIITAISGIIGSIGGLAIQFQVIARMLTLLLGIKGPWVTITAAAIVISYSAFGGIRSVIITDLFQFITFIIFIPILGLIVWNHLKDPAQIVNVLTTHSIFNLQQGITWGPKFLSAIGLMVYFTIPGMRPFIFQRVTMAKDLKQVKDSFTYAAGLDFLITMSIAGIAVLLLASDANLEPSNLVNYIITQYAYPSLKGLIAVGITAMAMSTADSHLNSSAILAVNDIIHALKLPWEKSLTMVRLFSLGLGICALLLALWTTDLLKLMLLAGSFYMPIVTVPLLLAIFGFRSSTRAVLIGMAAGFITVALWDKLLGHLGIDRLIPGMFANLIFFMGSHYLLREEGGWVGIKDPYPLLAARQERWNRWKNFIQAIKEPELYCYLKKNLPTKEIVYSLFGLYVLGATYASFFTIPENVVATYQRLYNHIAHSVLVITAGFITYPAWPPTFKAKRFIAFAWPVGICYILFLVGTILMVMSGFHQVQVMLFILNLVLTALLLDWRLMVGVVGSGILLAIGAFYLYTEGIPQIHVSQAYVQFKAIYGLPLFVSFLLAIISFRQSRDELEDKTNYLLILQKKEQDRLIEVANYREELLKELDPEEVKIFDQVTSEYLRQAIYRVRDYLRLDVSELSIDTLLSDIRTLLKVHQVKPRPQLVVRQLTKHQTIQTDIPKIKQLLINSISYIQAYNPNNVPIIITIEDTQLSYEISYMQDYMRKVEAIRIVVTTHKELPPLQEVYISKEQQEGDKSLSMTAELLPLVENARIIDAHYGYVEQNINKLHLYVIPVNIREVRGKVMELAKKPVGADPTELSHPLAIQLENELLTKLREIEVDMHVIRKALDVIKKYHGGVKRRSGEPYFTHPINVALILLNYSQDQDAIVAALLHDIVEDTSLSLSHIQAMFGEEVSFLVAKATNLENKLRRINLADHENIHRLLHHEDKRASLVKLADKLHNMRTIEGHPSLAKQKRIAEETLTFFVPMARHLGLTDMAEELEKISFEVLGK